MNWECPECGGRLETTSDGIMETTRCEDCGYKDDEGALGAEP